MKRSWVQFPLAALRSEGFCKFSPPALHSGHVAAPLSKWGGRTTSGRIPSNLEFPAEIAMAKGEFKRTKPHLNVGTIGHIDHGKSTLGTTAVRLI